MLVANKNDIQMMGHDGVSIEDGIEKAMGESMKFYSASAKTGD